MLHYEKLSKPTLQSIEYYEFYFIFLEISIRSTRSLSETLLDMFDKFWSHSRDKSIL